MKRSETRSKHPKDDPFGMVLASGGCGDRDNHVDGCFHFQHS